MDTRTLHNEDMRLYVLHRSSIKDLQRCSICKGTFGRQDEELIYFLGSTNAITIAAADYYGLSICNPFSSDPGTAVVLLHSGCLEELLPNICVTRVGDISATFYIPKYH